MIEFEKTGTRTARVAVDNDGVGAVLIGHLRWPRDAAACFDPLPDCRHLTLEALAAMANELRTAVLADTADEENTDVGTVRKANVEAPPEASSGSQAENILLYCMSPGHGRRLRTTLKDIAENCRYNNWGRWAVAADTAEQCLDQLTTPPQGYPECTSALLKLLGYNDGTVVLRYMHANEDRVQTLLNLVNKLVLAFDNKHRNSRSTIQRHVDQDKVLEAARCVLRKYWPGAAAVADMAAPTEKPTAAMFRAVARHIEQDAHPGLNDYDKLDDAAIVVSNYAKKLEKEEAGT